MKRGVASAYPSLADGNPPTRDQEYGISVLAGLFASKIFPPRMCGCLPSCHDAAHTLMLLLGSLFGADALKALISGGFVGVRCKSQNTDFRPRGFLNRGLDRLSTHTLTP